MSPLARMIVRDLTLPARRRVGDADGLAFARRLSDAHCFDVTEVWPMVEDLAHKIAYEGKRPGTLAFLPAKKTFIEFEDDGRRRGYLVEATDNDRQASFIDCARCHDLTAEQLEKLASGGTVNPTTMRQTYTAHDSEQVLYLRHPESPARLGWSTLPASHFEGECPADEIEAVNNWDPACIFAALALINAPRIIGRRQHMPHRGLERDLNARKRLIGKFPLHAWTEITLEVNAALDLTGADPAEAHLTGMRALHFCRAHLRVRYGNLEIVREHWRGDAALGIKQSRYRVISNRHA